MKKSYLFWLILVLIIAVGWRFFLISEEKKAANMENSQSAEETKYLSLKGEEMFLSWPQSEAEIDLPLEISGRARGTWFFEASFPVILADWDGRIIAETYASAKDEWMTTDFVPFEAIIERPTKDWPVRQNADYTKRGFLILKKENPSELPENDDSLEITIFFKDN